MILKCLRQFLLNLVRDDHFCNFVQHFLEDYQFTLKIPYRVLGTCSKNIGSLLESRIGGSWKLEAQKQDV